MLQPGLGRNGNWNDFFFFFVLTQTGLAKNESRITFFPKKKGFITIF